MSNSGDNPIKPTEEKDRENDIEDTIDTDPDSTAGTSKTGGSGKRQITVTPLPNKLFLSTYLAKYCKDKPLPASKLEEYRDYVRQLRTKPALIKHEADFLADWYLTTIQHGIEPDPFDTTVFDSQSDEEMSTTTTNVFNSDQVIKLNQLVEKPDKFNGVRPRPRDWLDSYNDARLFNGWNDVISIKYFKAFIEDAAGDWFKSSVLPQILNGEITKWSQLEEKFRSQYLGRQDHQSLVNYLKALQQRQGENVATFIPKVRKVLLSLEPTMSEKEQIRNISEKLRQEYRVPLPYHDIDTVDQLRDALLGFAE